MEFDGLLNRPVTADLTFKGPGGDSFVVTVYDTDVWAPPSDRIEGELAIPLHRAAGQWTVSVKVTDASGQTSSYGTPGDAPLPVGSTPLLNLANAGAVDLTPPRLTSGIITPDPVDVTVSQRKATLTLSAEDDAAINKGTVYLEDPSGVRYSLRVTAADRISGTAQSGVYQSHLWFSRFLRPETFAIRYVIEDKAGRVANYGPAHLAYPPGVKSSLAIANRGIVDEDPPRLTSFLADATVIDTALAAQSVRLQATLVAPVAGLTFASVQLAGGGHGFIEYRNLFESWAGTPPTTPVLVETTVVIPRNTPSGTYYWSMDAYDATGRVSYFNGALADSPFPPGATRTLIIANSGPPEEVPQVTSISTNLTTVDISQTPQPVNLSITLLDTVPGLESATLFLHDAEGNVVESQNIFTNTQPEAAPVTPVKVDTTIIVPRYLKPGPYHWVLYVADNPLISKVYGGAGGLAFPAGFSGILTVLNTGPVDSGPELLTISTNRTEVDVTSGPATVEFLTSQQDTLTGLWYGEISLLNAAGAPVANGSISYGWAAGVPPLTGPLESSNSISLGAKLPPGDYQWRLRTVDINNHETVYGGPGGAAFPGNFSGILRVINTGLVDTAGPALDSLQASPEILTPIDLRAPVLLQAKLRDPSGVASAEARFVIREFEPHLAVPLTLTSGTPTDGTWSGYVNLPGDCRLGSHALAVIARDQNGYSSSYGNMDRDDTHPYRRSLTHSLPVLSTQNLIVVPMPEDAFTTWLNSWPNLIFTTDPDGDGLPNSLEFLCGTDPLISSLPGGPDPSSARAPTYTLTPTHLRVDYQISRANASLGTSNRFSLIPQSTTGLNTPWSNLTPSAGTGEHWWAEVPRTGNPRQFLRMAVFQ